MLKRTLWSALLGLTCLATASELNTAPESLKIDVGADFRLRFDVQSDEIKSPTGNHKYGPHPSQYFDLRSRVWVKVQDKDSGLEAKLRLANRSKYYTSDWDAKNNYTTGNWSFPDEVFVDEAYLRFTKLGVQGLTLTFGRQNLQLGNGMVIYDGTNTDSSRSTYFDGIVAKYATENNTLHAFAFYDSWNDPIAIPLRWDKEDYPSGDGRALRPGDTLTLGLYNTHVFNDTFSLDTYYIYSDVQADDHGRLERKLPNDWDDLQLHTFGARLFGKLNDSWSYSAEFAHQASDADDDSINANMADLRLKYKLPILAELKPVLNLRYTYWSGDKGDGGTYEGWQSIYAERSGIFGEEASSSGGVPCGSNWTNLHAYHASIDAKPLDKLKLSTGATYFRADEYADGANVGVAAFATVGYDFTKTLSLKTTLSHMFYGDYYGSDRQDGGFWGRIELNWKI